MNYSHSDRVPEKVWRSRLASVCTWLRRMSIGQCVCAVNMHSLFRPLQLFPLPSQSFFVSLTVFEKTVSWPGWRASWGGKALILLLEDVCTTGCRIRAFLGVKYVGCTEKFICVHRLWIALKAKLCSLCMLNFAWFLLLVFFFFFFPPKKGITKRCSLWMVYDCT